MRSPKSGYICTDPYNTAQILITHQIKCDQICKNLPYTQETHKQLQVNHLAWNINLAVNLLRIPSTIPKQLATV